MIIANISKWIILIIIIAVVIFVIKTGAKILNILIMILTLMFIWFSFFTEEGAARLSIALTGHPIIAYTTKLKKQDNISNEETTYFKTSKEFTFEGKKLSYSKCYTKWIIRMPSIGQW